MEVKLIDPLRGGEWDRLVASHGEATFFHRSAWAAVLCKTYGHQPVYLHGYDGGETIALIPMMQVRSLITGSRGVCLPFTDVCAPLMFRDDERACVPEVLLRLARERKWKHFEIRGAQALPSSARPAVAFHGHTLDLRRGTTELLASFSSSVRRAIRKAERSGFNVEITRTADGIAQFYRLHVRTRKRHGLPPQPFSFFRHIHQEVIEAGLGFVVLATLDGRPAAAAVYFTSGSNAIYKFGASDQALQQARANNLVMWVGIKALAQEGFETLHFGRTSAGNEGLRRFKLGWGAREETIEYFRFDTRAEEWLAAPDRASGVHNVLFGRLPLAVNRMAGAVIYPHLD